MTITVINKDTVLYKMLSVTSNLTYEKQTKKGSSSGSHN